MTCCDEYGTCNQGRDCPARTGIVLQHQEEHANRVARIKSTRPAWLPGEGVPLEAGNFQIVDLGPDDIDQPAAHDEFMSSTRTLLSWLLAALATVGAVALAVSYHTEAHADVLWSFLQGVAS